MTPETVAAFNAMGAGILFGIFAPFAALPLIIALELWAARRDARKPFTTERKES